MVKKVSNVTNIPLILRPLMEADTIVYSVSGHGAIISGLGGSIRQELKPGDFALIPAFAEHQEVNDSDADIVWVISRGGRNPTVHNLEGWRKVESKSTV